ncbi:MAG: hypothetical protein AAB443_01410 [Patescibacteria group bacterium]
MDQSKPLKVTTVSGSVYLLGEADEEGWRTIIKEGDKLLFSRCVLLGSGDEDGRRAWVVHDELLPSYPMLLKKPSGEMFLTGRIKRIEAVN